MSTSRSASIYHNCCGHVLKGNDVDMLGESAEVAGADNAIGGDSPGGEAEFFEILNLSAMTDFKG